MKIPKDENDRRNETKSTLNALSSAIITNMPIINNVWDGIQAYQNERWKYRVEEFLCFFNQENFINKLLNNGEFQEIFAITFKAYVNERKELKREYIRNILVNCEKINDKELEGLEIERFLHIINIILIEELTLLTILNSTASYSLGIFKTPANTLDFNLVLGLKALGLAYENHEDISNDFDRNTHDIFGRKIDKSNIKNIYISKLGKDLLSFLNVY